MLAHFALYFLLFGFCLMFFIIISSDTRNMNAHAASRMNALNTLCVEYITPYYCAGCLVIIPTVIVWYT